MTTTTPKAAAPKAAAKKPAAKPRTSVGALEASAPSTSAVDTIAGGTLLVREIPIALIDPHPMNPRQNLGDLGELAESIRAHGVQQPAKVVPHPDVEGRYLTVMGHRRIAAATMAGRDVVPAIVDEHMDEVHQLEVMLVENLQRHDLTISEEGAGYQGLLDFGMSQPEIVRRTGRAKNTVAARVKIAALPEPVRRYVDQHQLTIEEALAFGEWKDTHPEVWQENIEKLTNPHAQVDVLVRTAKQKVFELDRLAAEVVAWQSMGHKLIAVENAVIPGDRTSIRALGIKVDDHAHCPGAEVYIGTQSWWLNGVRWQGTFACADAATHHPEELAATHISPDDAEERRLNEEREERIAAAQAERAAIAATVFARRVWLVDSFGADRTDVRVAALSEIAERAAAWWVFSGDGGYLLVEGAPWSVIPEGATPPSHPEDVLPFTMLAVLESGIPTAAESVHDEWDPEELLLLIAYLEACAKFGHDLHEHEQLLIRAAQFALDNQATEAVDENAVDVEEPTFDDADGDES